MTEGLTSLGDTQYKHKGIKESYGLRGMCHGTNHKPRELRIDNSEEMSILCHNSNDPLGMIFYFDTFD